MNDPSQIKPYHNEEGNKKEQVAQMFDNISKKYDVLNHTLSFGIDKLWRRKAIKMLKKYHPQYILDVATGTGDFALAALKLNPEKIIGVDISKGMLAIGQEKIIKKNLQDKVTLMYNDSEALTFENHHFDAITVGFGVRNFENLKKGLGEMHRVLKKGGHLVILEFSKPTLFPFKQFYHFYFKFILPKIGRYISKDHAAYSYLPASVGAFPSGNKFMNILEETGFKPIQCIPLTLGVSSLYIVTK